MDLISVIICTYNRERYIGACLESLRNQTLDKAGYEVIVVDNNSTDRTPEISKAFIADAPGVQARYVLETQQGHTFARNRGVEESSGGIVVFLDDDAEAAPEYLEEIGRFFANHPDAAAMGGKILPKFEVGRPEWMSSFLMPLTSTINLGEQDVPFKGRKYPIGANMAFRRRVFDQYGLFNVRLGRRGTGLEGSDEKDLFMRLKRAGEPILYAPRAWVWHNIPEKRLEMDYIRGQATGIGSGERTRALSEGPASVVKLYGGELAKWGATFGLAGLYFLKGEPAKARMLVRFRSWVTRGMLKG